MDFDATGWNLSAKLMGTYYVVGLASVLLDHGLSLGCHGLMLLTTLPRRLR